MTPRISVIIPALNEAEAIGNVVRSFLDPLADYHVNCTAPMLAARAATSMLDVSGALQDNVITPDNAKPDYVPISIAMTRDRAIPGSFLDGVLVHECIVVDNGSTDATVSNARKAGARVVSEPRRGYGRACATGAAAADPCSDVLVFVDGDGSDIPEELPLIAGPVLLGEYDFVLGSRTRGHREEGSLLPSQLFAGWLAGKLLRLRYGVRYTDMGPFRAISRTALQNLHMSEMTYGWNLEMQMKAARSHLRILEVPVSYRNRQGGVSKVAGSLQGSLNASLRIAQVFVRISFSRN